PATGPAAGIGYAVALADDGETIVELDQLVGPPGTVARRFRTPVVGIATLVRHAAVRAPSGLSPAEGRWVRRAARRDRSCPAPTTVPPGGTAPARRTRCSLARS